VLSGFTQRKLLKSRSVVFNVYAGLNLPPGNSQRQKLRNVIAEPACAVTGRLACCAKTCIGNRKKLPGLSWQEQPQTSYTVMCGLCTHFSTI